MSVLVTTDLAKDYGEGYGLEPTSLAVGGGELVLLVGPNGAGKSTFLRLVTGLLEPTSGEATVSGHPVGSIGARAATSFVPDQPVLYDDLTVLEHLEYVARLHGRTEWAEDADVLLAELQLTDRAEGLPSRFSRGLRQKTSLAVGLIRPHELLLVDEPFAGLDATGQQVLVRLLQARANAGTAVVVSSHQFDLADVATRCLGVRDGAVIYSGPSSRSIVADLVGL
jgi:ABC-type multidrug transport system ATPase subunit